MNARTIMIAAPAYAFEVIAEALAPLSAGLIPGRRGRGHFSIIMARALPMQVAPLNAREVEITYRAIGADEVFSVEAHGGLEALRLLVEESLPQAND